MYLQYTLQHSIIRIHLNIQVFTVYAARGLYVLPRAESEEVLQHEGGTIPCTVKTMRQLSCTDRLHKATARLATAPE